MLYLIERKQESKRVRQNLELYVDKCMTSTQSAAYSVTPADQMSTLNPEKVSSPLAISGG